MLVSLAADLPSPGFHRTINSMKCILLRFWQWIFLASALTAPFWQNSTGRVNVSVPFLCLLIKLMRYEDLKCLYGVKQRQKTLWWLSSRLCNSTRTLTLSHVLPVYVLRLAGAAGTVSPLTAAIAAGPGRGNRWVLSRAGGYAPCLQRFIFIYS